jgi:hypothetical protein
MSDTSQGPGWWQASNGKWYEPELHPSYVRPLPPAPNASWPLPQTSGTQPPRITPDDHRSTGARCHYCEWALEPDAEICGQCGSLIGEPRVPGPHIRPTSSIKDDFIGILKKNGLWGLSNRKLVVIGVNAFVTLLIIAVFAKWLAQIIVVLIVVSGVVALLVRQRQMRLLEEQNAWEVDRHRKAVQERQAWIESERRRRVNGRIASLKRKIEYDRLTLKSRSHKVEGDNLGLYDFDVVEAAYDKDTATVAGLTAAELLWSWMRIDPQVVRAASFSLPNYDIDGKFDFIRFIAGHFSKLSEAGQEHSFNKLLGYVGEQQYYDLMVSNGHAVTSAVDPNNPAWDFIVDGQLVNVKTYADAAQLHETALSAPNVHFAVPQDIAGHLTSNMEHIGGLDHHEIATQVHKSIAEAKGDAAITALTHHLPVIMIGRATVRGYAEVRAGQQLATAVKFGAIDVTSKTVGVLVFVKGGIFIGHFASPVGSMVGAVAGAVVGVTGGTKLANYFKTRKFHDAEDAIRDLLANYWDTAQNGADRLERIIIDELDGRNAVREELRKSTDALKATQRWKRWPSESDVLLVTTDKLAAEASGAARKETSELRRLLSEAQRSAEGGGIDTRLNAAAKLGAMLANAPELADWLGSDCRKLKAIATARRTLMQEREKLAPGFTPCASAKSVIARAEEKVPVLWYQWHGSIVPIGRQSQCHALSAALTPHLRSSCTVLDASLVEFRESAKTPSGLRKLQMRRQKGAETTLKTVVGKIGRHACDECRPALDKQLADELGKLESPRPGWRVELSDRSWYCVAHGRKSSCDDCSNGI